MTPFIHRIHIPDILQELHDLPMGGTSPQGREIRVNSRYLTLDGEPWLPVMGEFHFSRYPREYWEEELRKIKAGGITCVATYLFWIHIEEIEGQYSWSGNNDLRHFVQLCDLAGLYVYPRIGPWAHGECRNGGFPDWLIKKCGNEVRTDAPLYLHYVRRFYQEIFQQLRGMFWKDGGPIIGIQIENELLNNAGHIQTLLNIAREVGFDVPLYTMTGWGPADVPASREIIPVFGGYPDAFWERQVEGWARNARKHYFFSRLRDDNTIGADLNRREGTLDLDYLEAFPFGTCEIGGGMQIAYHRRPFIEADDVAALAQVKIGNGSNLQGYYMYHGGANPIGQKSTMQESQETGYWNDLPVINYDFQAPIGQYGQVRETYHALRLQNLFLREFGTSLAKMAMSLPDVQPANLDDTDTLRWAVRLDGRRAFVFINNYQRIERLPDHPLVQFQIRLPDEEIMFPARPVEIPSGMYAIWPINLEMEGALLKNATAQPVCRLTADGMTTYVFFAQNGILPEFAFDAQSVRTVEGVGRHANNGESFLIDELTPGTGCCFRLHTSGRRQLGVLVLTQAQSRQLWKARLWGQDRLLLCADSLYFMDDRLCVQVRLPRELDLAVFPRPVGIKTSTGQGLFSQEDGLFTRYTLDLPATRYQEEANAQVPVRLLQPPGLSREVPIGPLGVAQAPDDDDFRNAGIWEIDIPESTWALFDHPQIKEVFLHIKYTGDAARLYRGDQLLDDQFYYGEPWEIGLSRFRQVANGQALTIRILPLRKDAPIYLPKDKWPDFGGKEEVAELEEIQQSVLASVELVSS